MQGGTFDEESFFAAVQRSGARALLIGRRALVALGIPVMTAEYDLWVSADDIERLNAALEPLDLHPNRTPENARRVGRYVLENDERVDVLVARRVSTKDDATVVDFEAVWTRRRTLPYAPGVPVVLPSPVDLILTKRWALRDKDIGDIRLLEALVHKESSQ